MSGYALCSWYKQMCRDEERPIGYVAAITAEPDEATSAAFGMDRCIPKPLSTQSIVDTLKAYWQIAAKRSPPPSPKRQPPPPPPPPCSDEDALTEGLRSASLGDSLLGSR